MVAVDERGEFCGLCYFFVVFGGFYEFFVVFRGFVDFFFNFVRVLCEIGLLSFSIRACIGVSTCSLCEVGLVGPETCVLITFVVDALSYVWPLLMASRLICSVYPGCGCSHV